MRWLATHKTFSHQAPHFQHLECELKIMARGDLDVLMFSELD